jgi:uncharacterized protein YndB with AHSA1/START domain
MLRKNAALLLIVIIPTLVPVAASADRVLRTELVIDAPIETLWRLWTTEAGITSFFAPGCRIEPRVDGAFEIYFNPAATPGQRGAEGTRIVAFEPDARLAFTWNAPPNQPTVRAQRTIVDLRFLPQGSGTTRIVFTHYGWGDGPEWDSAYDYFDQAWNTFVLPNFVWRVAHGPVDWKNLPQGRVRNDSLKLELVPRR